MSVLQLPVGWYVVLAILSASVVLLTTAMGGGVALTGAAVAAPWAVWALARHSEVSLRAGFFLVLVAGLKFRERDPLASVQASLDAQVLYELAVYAFIGCTVLLALFRLPSRAWRLTAVESLLAGYVLFAVASVAWSPIRAYSLVRSTQLVVLFAYAIVVTRTLGVSETWRTLNLSLVVYTAFFALLYWALSVAGIADLGSRLSWFGLHPIQTGAFAGVAALWFVAGLLFGPRHRWPSRAGRILGLVGFVTILGFTVSRGPILAFVVASLALALIRAVPRSVATLGVVTASALMLLVLNVPGGLTGLVEDLMVVGLPGIDALMREQTPELLLSMTGRIGLWRELFPSFLDHPLVGHGYQVARVVGLEIAPWAGEAHNALLQSLIDVGILGTVLLTAPLLWILLSSYRSAVILSSSDFAAYVSASRFAAVLFLFIAAVGSAGYTGVPGFESLLIFTAGAALHGSGRIPRSTNRSPRRR